MKYFSNDWFSGNIPNWSKHLDKYKGKPKLNFLEIGSYEGMSASWLMDNILTHPTSKLTCIDTFEGSYEHKLLNIPFDNVYDNFLNNTKEYGEKIKIFKLKSAEALVSTKIQKQKFDFVYVDGSHEAKNVMQDAVLTFDLLKVGGIIIFDDYLWKPDNLATNSMVPKYAIERFCLTYAEYVKILFVDKQVALEKKKSTD